MIVKNANTLAHGGVHLLVLAHLQRRWSLRGREGFGVFVEMKCLFSITLDARTGGEDAEVIIVVFGALDTGFVASNTGTTSGA
jgi:hypothetical protein